jgi:tRNA(Leu) C34 or U34 (ribose-2'-O)-methylase TrmL
VADKRYSCIGLYNPKSPENVGSVMRAAGCYGVASVFYTGKRYERAADFVTDTKRVHYDIPLIGIDDLKKSSRSTASRSPWNWSKAPARCRNTPTRIARCTSSARRRLAG